VTVGVCEPVHAASSASPCPGDRLNAARAAAGAFATAPPPAGYDRVWGHGVRYWRGYIGCCGRSRRWLAGGPPGKAECRIELSPWHGRAGDGAAGPRPAPRQTVGVDAMLLSCSPGSPRRPRGCAGAVQQAWITGAATVSPSGSELRTSARRQPGHYPSHRTPLGSVRRPEALPLPSSTAEPRLHAVMPERRSAGEIDRSVDPLWL
jgi:hypothetical protein